MSMSMSMSMTGGDGAPGIVLLRCLSCTVSALDPVGPILSSFLGVGESVVPGGARILLMEFSEFF